MTRIFISLSDKDKRVILIFFLLLIVVVAFFAVVGAIITRIMKWQGKKMDDLCHDVVHTNVIDNRKAFLRYARIKNWYTFFKQAWIPLVIIIISVAIILTYSAAKDWNYDLLDYEKTGFNTIFFIWDFDDPNIYHKFFFMNLICDWPTIINYPHFQIEAWASYLFFFGMVIGGGWYLIALQCVIARTYRMYKLSYDLYRKSLEGFNKYENDQKQSK